MGFLLIAADPASEMGTTEIKRDMRTNGNMFVNLFLDLLKTASN